MSMISIVITSISSIKLGDEMVTIGIQKCKNFGRIIP